jgi:hypothetical protein
MLSSIGIWISDLPCIEDESKVKKNPYVWAACTRFILSKDSFFKTYSPSSDKNTFLLCCFDSKSIDTSVEFYEFKIVQNNPSHKTKAHNSWVIIESEKNLSQDENNQFPDLVKCPSVFKKPTDKSDRCNVYTLGKYLSKYEFGNEDYKYESHRSSATKRKTSVTSKRKKSNSKCESDFNMMKSLDNQKEGKSLKLLHTIDKKRYNTNGVPSPDPKGTMLSSPDLRTVSVKNSMCTQNLPFETTQTIDNLCNVRPNSSLNKLSSPIFKTLDMDNAENQINVKEAPKRYKNASKHFERISVAKISRKSQNRNSFTQVKHDDKFKEPISKKYKKQVKPKTKRRPGSASDKPKQKKLVKKNELLMTTTRAIDVEKQLDMLYEANFSVTNNKIQDS